MVSGLDGCGSLALPSPDNKESDQGHSRSKQTYAEQRPEADPAYGDDDDTVNSKLAIFNGLDANTKNIKFNI